MGIDVISLNLVQQICCISLQGISPSGVIFTASHNPAEYNGMNSAKKTQFL